MNINFDYIKFVLIRKRLYGIFQNNDKRKIDEELRAYKFLKKHYYKCISEFTTSSFSEHNTSKYIWFCWLDGIDKAPVLVRRCYDTLVKYNSEKQVVIIDKNNFMNYVKVPEIIIDKWKRGLINGAHFSDLLRVLLLEKYGGVWSDSTCYYTAPIPEYIYKNSLFFFNNERKRSIIRISNWFISAAPNNCIIKEMKRILLLYWEKYDAPVHYFFFHLLVTLIYEKNQFTSNDYLLLPNMNTLALNHELNNKYNYYKFDVLRKISFVHKLNRKTIINDMIKDNFYNILIEEN